MSSTLEPAIPSHLTCPRTQPSSLPPNYQPPFPAYCARFPEAMQNLTMAVIGFQHHPSSKKQNAHSNNNESRDKLLSFLQSPQQDITPAYYELAAYVDAASYRNEAAFAYWPSASAYDTWAEKSGFADFWEELDPKQCGEVGWFLEVFSPSMDRFETVFSNDTVPEGAAHMREKVSGPMREHVYWGSMRDRLAASQTDALEGELRERAAVRDTNSQRIRVAGRQNLCAIRSGQDWSGTKERERKLYLETMHPVLVRGMEFLANEGSEVGCLSNRFMDVVDHTDPARPTDKTFGLGYFDSIASLEGWSKQHKTHLDIFGRFLQYAAELQNHVTLRLFHEVVVLQPEQQFFEYVGCHRGTGLLGSMAADVVS